MKKLKKFLLILTALVLCFSAMPGNTITAKADEANPVTYYVKFVESQNAWRFQFNPWDDTLISHDISIMNGYIKDGDIVVIDSAKLGKSISLNLSVRLSNLTVVSTSGAIVTANGIDEFYALNDSVSAINSDIKNAYVYDYSTVNFNNKVDNVNIVSTIADDLLHANVGANSTVGHIKATSNRYTHFEYFDFKSGTLSVVNGTLKTDASNYSKTAPAAPVAPSTPSAPSAGEYDDVPKTADIRFNPLWLVAIAAVCMTGSCALKKSTR